MSHLLDGIAKHFAPKVDVAETHANLTRELESVRAEITAAEADRNRAAEQLKSASQTLQESILERERRELRLRDLRAGDLLKLLEDDSKLKEDVERALRQVGAPAALESIAELDRVVDQSYSIGGRAASLVASIFNGRNVSLIIGGMVLLFVAPPAIAWLVENFVTTRAAALSAFAAQFTVVVGSVSAVIARALKHAKTALDTLSEAKRKVDERLAARRATPSDREKQLENELAEAKANEQAAAERVAFVSARAKELEDRVAAYERARSLDYFIAERSQSDDYRRHLGLISVVRKDFDGLVQRLRDGQMNNERRVDRIVLYIDDVDRCPPNIVVDILQAVHLLLAYELFVVVVSVDPRWLLRSLAVKFSHLQGGGAIAEGIATPHDYLDKIFQVPFSVRPMNDLAFGRMMRRFLAPTIAGTTLFANGGEKTVHRNEMGAPSGDSNKPPSSEQENQKATHIEPGELDKLARAIAISEAEASFAERLHGLLATPRSAKRFSNVYRLLKASVSNHEIAAFEGTAAVPGAFQLPMLLLAALIGDPSSASVLFPQFRDRAAQGQPDWWVRSAGAREDNESATRMRQTIELTVANSMFPHDSRLVLDWLPRVARFSFLTARMFLEAR